MRNVKNQHRWEKWVDDRIRNCLAQAAERLARAWKVDEEHPRSYPINTGLAFAKIKQQLRGQLPRSAKVITLSPPRTLLELIDERTIKSAYEEQNDGSYEKALNQAAERQGSKTWRKIWRAIDTAYWISYYSIEFAPRPKVQFLHRNLLEIAESKEVGGLSLEGVVEFFDDICPCGKGHKPDTIRKLRQRRSRASRSQP